MNTTTTTPRPRVKTISLVVDNCPNHVEQPPQEVICLQCPNARWKHNNKNLSCFCYMHHADTYPHEEFHDCDEYRITIMKIEEEKKNQGQSSK